MLTTIFVYYYKIVKMVTAYFVYDVGMITMVW